MIADWTVPFTLVTDRGTIYFNEPSQTEGYYIIDKGASDEITEIRATRNGVPQNPGSILHRGFYSGVVLNLTLEYWTPGGKPACKTTDPTSQAMDDLLLKNLDAILNGGGRILFTPTGQPQRLIDELRWIGEAKLTEEDTATTVAFTLASPFPYAIDFEQTLTVLTEASPTDNLINTGTTEFYPVFKIYGPFFGFELTNADNLDDDGNPFKIVYDSDLPGAVSVPGGDYIEIDTFRNTVYLNGDGASRKAGIDIEQSDFFSLVVGNNNLTIVGDGGSNVAPDADVLWQAAWV